MKKKAVKLILGILIVGAMIAAAYWGGKKASHMFAEQDHETLLQKRQEMTMGVLKNMEIAEGDTLPDYQFFETLESETERLSNLVTEPTWLAFVQPDCQACLEELDHIRPFIDKNSKTQIIIISNSNPLDLIDLQEHYELNCPILHDRNSTYIDGIRAFTLPFNILVDSNLVIMKLVASQLQKIDFE